MCLALWAGFAVLHGSCRAVLPFAKTKGSRACKARKLCICFELCLACRLITFEKQNGAAERQAKQKQKQKQKQGFHAASRRELLLSWQK